MTGKQMAREVMTVSSGTLSRLFGTRWYDEIHRTLNAWVSWLMNTHLHFDDYRHAWFSYNVWLESDQLDYEHAMMLEDEH